MSVNSRIAAARAKADSELKKALATVNLDDFGTQLPAFQSFVYSIKQLFFEEADDLLRKSVDRTGLERALTALRQRIIDEYAKAPDARRLTERERWQMKSPMPIEQTLHNEPVDKWEIFSPAPLLPNIKQAVRNELESVLGKQTAYWIRQSVKGSRLDPQATTAPETRGNAAWPANESEEDAQHLKAPVFIYQYPDDFPDSEQLAIERARLNANQRLEDKEIRSYDEHRAVRVEWFWDVVSVAAADIGRAGAVKKWGANRRREMLLDYGAQAARAAGIAGRDDSAFQELCRSERWRALDKPLLPVDVEHRKPIEPQKPSVTFPPIAEPDNSPPKRPLVLAVTNAAEISKARAATVAKLIRELNALRPVMIEDENEYARLQQNYPDFLCFNIAATRYDLKIKILAIRGSARHIRLAQELAAAHHSKQFSTIKEDWKSHKPDEFRHLTADQRSAMSKRAKASRKAKRNSGTRAR